MAAVRICVRRCCSWAGLILGKAAGPSWHVKKNERSLVLGNYATRAGVVQARSRPWERAPAPRGWRLDVQAQTKVALRQQPGALMVKPWLAESPLLLVTITMYVPWGRPVLG